MTETLKQIAFCLLMGTAVFGIAFAIVSTASSVARSFFY